MIITLYDHLKFIMRTVHLVIKGKVQGVFYRASAKDRAEDLGITGWVKNTREGFVETVASGDDKAVQQFIEWCKKGPSNARVDDVVVTEQSPEQLNGFTIKRD